MSCASSEYKVKIQTLEEIYRDQLLILRKLCVSHHNTEDIRLCKRWIGIFSNASETEKMARNCLCSLMEQQMKEGGYLESPFTNVMNFNRDLNHILDSMNSTETNSIDINSAHNAIDRTFDSHPQQSKCPFDKIYEKHLAKNLCNNKVHYFRPGSTSPRAEYEKNTQSDLLHELALYRTENNNLKTTIELQADQLTNINEKLLNLKRNVLDGLERLVGKMSNVSVDDMQLPSQFLKGIFGVILTSDVQNEFENAEVEKKLSNLDDSLQRFMIKKQKSSEGTDLQLIAKTKRKYKEKYRQRTQYLTWVQRVQLQLVRMKLFSEMRELCMKYRDSPPSERECHWTLVEELENVIKVL